MVSTDDSEFARKLASLKDQEAELISQRLQQQQIEERIIIQQQHASEKERANQLKTQDLIKREKKAKQDSQLFNTEKQSFEQVKLQFFAHRQRRARIIVPVILLACIASGYFAFEQLSKKDKQITSASENIDKLARILSFTQAEMLRNSRNLENEKAQQSATQKLLAEIKNTSERLEVDIHQMSDDPANGSFEKNRLSIPIGLLGVQLKKLNNQFQKYYLSSEFNETAKHYNEIDLSNFKRVTPKNSVVVDESLMPPANDSSDRDQVKQTGLRSENRSPETRPNNSQKHVDSLEEPYQKMSQN